MRDARRRTVSGSTHAFRLSSSLHAPPGRRAGRATPPTRFPKTQESCGGRSARTCAFRRGPANAPHFRRRESRNGGNGAAAIAANPGACRSSMMSWGARHDGPGLTNDAGPDRSKTPVGRRSSSVAHFVSTRRGSRCARSPRRAKPRDLQVHTGGNERPLRRQQHCRGTVRRTCSGSERYRPGRAMRTAGAVRSHGHAP